MSFRRCVLSGYSVIGHLHFVLGSKRRIRSVIRACRKLEILKAACEEQMGAAERITIGGAEDIIEFRFLTRKTGQLSEQDDKRKSRVAEHLVSWG